MAADADTLGEFLKDIAAATAPYQEKYQKAREQICPKDDGNVCRRVTDVVFKGAKSENAVVLNQTDKIKLLIYAGDFANGGADFYSRELRRVIGMSHFDYAVVLTKMKRFFPIMSGSLDVKKIYTTENWEEILKL